jgi:hypothetical protein
MFQKAVGCGCSCAPNYLATWYATAEDVEKDEIKAFQSSKNAVEMKDVFGMHNFPI